MHPKDADRMANSVDPDQEQSDLGLHCFVQTCLSENLGSLRLNLVLEQISVKNLLG